MTQKQLVELLEPLVDGTPIAEVLEALVEVCMLKADHIQDNWQDKILAQKWHHVGIQIAKASLAAEKHGL